MEIANFSQDWLDIIKRSNFLQDWDYEALISMKSELQDTFEKKQIWRTETEMRISVLNDVNHPTNASKYWQAVREQAVFFENLVTLSFDYRRNNIEILKLQRKLGTEEDELEKEIIIIDIEEKKFHKKNMEIASKDRMREIKLWSKIKSELDDGTFNTTDVNNHQLDSYTRQFILQSIIAWDSGSPWERNNLKWLMQTAIRKSKEEWIFDNM